MSKTVVRLLIKDFETIIRAELDEEYKDFPDKAELAYLKRQRRKAKKVLLEEIFK